MMTMTNNPTYQTTPMPTPIADPYTGEPHADVHGHPDVRLW